MSQPSTITSFIHELKSTYDEKDLFFMNKQLERVKRSKPYKGLRILQNVPFTKEALIKSEALYEGGGEITMTSPGFMYPDIELIKKFQSAGGEFISLDSLGDREFDVYLDCAAELLPKRPPKIGTVEITGTGTYKYGKNDISYPVISIDQSLIKNLEGTLGTGEAFIRAFKEITHEENIENRSFMIFGYGKVGRGIAYHLNKQGAHVTIVETEEPTLKRAVSDGFDAISAYDKSIVEDAANRMFCIVTATGRENIISGNYNIKVFQNKYLANMGGDDEFGDGFEDTEILCGKKPINFFIAEPTLLRYLDPVFYAHNLGIDVLIYSNLTNGLHAFPSFIAEEVVQEWIQIFNEKIPDGLL
ncbi:hypothetical protein F3J23_14610 [Chryseobacterium sp. Tr-659]|uniref:NAD(P)-dependent oxidoreductase n=1 Tax=Chryseobacterium sp. Tr-659 TaxID=2608340 RepID=UPI00141F0BEC|nr:NAD(P)-dependent oxidoreductase [Chryseobacterium sp. Tr-659]NIF06679.1 hypothetical protein [Chryseobacterium sp. Tr-659]